MPQTALASETMAIVTGTLLMLAGIALLRAIWARRSGFRVQGIFAGWLLIAAGAVVYAVTLGSESGTGIAIAGVSALAYVVIATGAERRTARPLVGRELALEPEERPTNWPRAITKALLAMVLAGIAAIGIGIAFAVAMPMHPPDRIVIGGLLVPMLWGGGMAWTLSDARLLRATLLLMTVSAIAYGIAFLPKVLSS